MTLLVEPGCQVNSDGGFADATFGICDCNNHLQAIARLQAITQALFSDGLLQRFQVNGKSTYRACKPDELRYVLHDVLLARRPARTPTVTLASGIESVPTCMQAIRQPSEISPATTPIQSATNRSPSLPCEHFHREKLPKHCLGEKCDIKICACDYAWAVNAPGTVHHVGVGY